MTLVLCCAMSCCRAMWSTSCLAWRRSKLCVCVWGGGILCCRIAVRQHPAAAKTNSSKFGAPTASATVPVLSGRRHSTGGSITSSQHSVFKIQHITSWGSGPAPKGSSCRGRKGYHRLFRAARQFLRWFFVVVLDCTGLSSVFSGAAVFWPRCVACPLFLATEWGGCAWLCVLSLRNCTIPFPGGGWDVLK